MPKRVFYSLFCGLVLFNLTTLLFSAWTEGYVHDEPMYVEIGKMVLNGNQPNAGWGHPPLSVWTGTWLPWKLGHFNDFHPTTLFLARLSHILINSVGTLWVGLILYKVQGAFASLFFLSLISTLGVLKFVTSHHLTDSDSAILAMVSLVWLWAKPPKTPFHTFGPFLLFWLATMSKVSMIPLLPFALLPVIGTREKVSHYLRVALLLATSLFVALCITYRFQWGDFGQFYEILRIQLGRAGSGAPNSLLGQRVDNGIWYYYLVVSFFKLPLLFTGLLVYAMFLYFKKGPKSRDAFFFLAPALLLFLIFSRSSLQLGFRYITTSMILFCLFIAVTLERTLLKKWLALSLIAFPLASLDLYSLATGSYQTYFNFLAPRPALNFSDSNIDWHQKIPRHLESLAPVAEPVSNYLNFLLDPAKEMEIFQITSMELNNIWKHPAGVLFRSSIPFLTLAGHEFHSMTKENLFQRIEELAPFHSSGTQSFEPWDRVFQQKAHCQNSHKFHIRAAPLFDLQKILRSAPEVENAFTKEVPISFPHLGKSLVVIESSGAVDLEIEGTKGLYPRGSLEEYRHYSYWFPIQVLSKIGTVSLRFERRNKTPNSHLTAKTFLLWYECL